MQRNIQNVTRKISDFEVDGITFGVGGRNKKGKQLKDADKGYIVKYSVRLALMITRNGAG